MKNRWFRDLCDLLASAHDAKEVEAILVELLTPRETEAITERWQIVQMLLRGHSQREIRDHHHVAIATVSRGSRVLKYGQGALLKHFEKLHDAA
jgi:TrpR family transcriptional regulator, trp operon repressor